MSEKVALPSVVCPLQWRNVRCRFAGVRVSVALLAVCCALQGGCAAVPKNEPLQLTSGVQSGGLPADQFEYGRPNRLVDGTGWVLGIPSRILLWNRRVDNHDVGSQTTVAMGDYLAANELGDVKVRVNQYAPLDEWRRLRENKKISGGWRYTLGTLNTLAYTVLPGRLFGGDWYNPYTDTVHLYSDVPSIALYEAAYAKDVDSREHRGWYAFSQQLPVLNVWHMGLAREEVWAYLRETGDAEGLREAYNVLTPRNGAMIFMSVASLAGGGGFAINPAVPAFGALVGHAYGRSYSSRVPDELSAQVLASEEPPAAFESAASAETTKEPAQNSAIQQAGYEASIP